MKQLSYALLAMGIGISVPAFAQMDKNTDGRSDSEKGLIEEVLKIEKKTDKFNLFLDMHADFDAGWTGSEFDGGKFRFQQLRVEARGNINNWLSYRYRQRLNKGDNPNGYFDNVLGSIDIAGMGVKLDKWSLFLGKQCAAYGGIEFDLNPIEIYQYSDMVDYMSNFMTGVNVAYHPNSNQEFQFQILDALTGSSESMYGNYTKAKLPFVYTLNWNGSFGGVYNSRWSASFMNETKGEHMWYFALGNDFKISEKVGMYFDWMYSLEGVDRKGIITDIVAPNGYSKKAGKTDIMSFILHANYRFHPAWNIFAKLMYENEGVYKTNDMGVFDVNGREEALKLEKGKYRTALGYIAGVEFYPFKDRSLHFFATYVGRDYKYTDKAKAFGAADYNTNNVQVGFIWHMPVF